MTDATQLLDKFLDQLQHLSFLGDLSSFIRALVFLIMGLILAAIARLLVAKTTTKLASTLHARLFQKVVFYTVLILFLVLSLGTLGVPMGTLLGAASILTVAFGLASQTVISNLVSGLFLISEQPFVMGDLIEVNQLIGEVLSVDLLSIKIRTKDNTMVRIPNESLLKSQLRNISRFPIRRCDIMLYIDFQQDFEQVKSLLLMVAKQNPLCLSTPIAEVDVLNFSESAILLRFSIWGKQFTYSDLRNTTLVAIQQAFQQAGIAPPTFYPWREEKPSLTHFAVDKPKTT